MSNATYSSQAFKPESGAGKLIRELLAATPLSIFIAAVKAAPQPAAKR